MFVYGKFKGYEWDIFEEPQVKVPITDFRKTDNLTTEKSFRDICKQVEGYGKPIGNLRAFVKRCLKNYFEGNIIRYSPKRNSFNDFQQNEYDFEELERAILSN